MLHYPDQFPAKFKAIAAVAFTRHAVRVPGASRTKQRVKAQVFAVAEISCTAAEAGEWTPQAALFGLKLEPSYALSPPA